MTIEIGKHYTVNLAPQYFNTEVRATSKELKAKYPTYGKLQGKEVVILATTVKKTAYKMALIEEGDNYWFTLDGKWVKPVSSSSFCVCEMQLLLTSGCKCGAFKREQTTQKPQFTPW
jgi:hypothetical protein